MKNQNAPTISRFDIEDMVGNVSMLTNHEEDSYIQADINALAEHLEVYL